MSESHYAGEALELLFTRSTPGWFSPFATATAGLTAKQAATVPAPHFNSVWAVSITCATGKRQRYSNSSTFQSMAQHSVQRMEADGLRLEIQPMKLPGMKRGAVL